MTERPTQASLDSLFARATRARLIQAGASNGQALPGPVLAEVSGADLGAVGALLRIVEGGEEFHCMCLGDLAVEILDGDRPLTTLGFHHAVSLRHPEWSSDAVLIDGPGLPRWLAARGAPGPLRAYEQAVERRRLADDARRAWSAAAPPCLAADLPRFEEDGPGASDLAAHRVRAAYPTLELAAAALLRWYGSGAGPWSGYPSYESLPETLLVRLGLAHARAAASGPAATDDLLRGAARLFSSWDVVANRKHEVAEVAEPLWARLRPSARATGLPDNLQRFEHAAAIAAEARRRRARPAPVPAGSGLTVVGVSNHGALSSLVTDGDVLYAGDGRDVVSFAPGSTAATVLHTGANPGFQLASPVSTMLFVADTVAGTIAKVLTESRKLVVMARDQARPMDLVSRPLAWINQAVVPDAARGAPGVGLRSSVMWFGPPQVVIRAAPAHAFSLVSAGGRLYWCELDQGAHSIWCHLSDRPGAPSRLAELGPRPAAAAWWPQLATSGEHVLWADPDRGAIVGVAAGGGPLVRLADTPAPPFHLVADDDDVFALAGVPDAHEWQVVHCPARGGAARTVARYQRHPADHPSMVLTASALFFTSGDRVLMLPRA